jgi:FG-GAP-like repeat/PASTA domain
VLLNRGDGSFQPKLDYGTGSSPFAVAIGDLNGDAKPDLATANYLGESTVSVLLNRGDGSFQPRLDYPTGPYARSVAIGDLNGDAKPDLATANYGASVSVFANRGGGRFSTKLDYETGTGAVSVAIGDLNGDGKPDLATANEYDNAVSVLANNTVIFCEVPRVRRKKLADAKRAIASGLCRVGKIRRAYSKTVRRGRVISQKPKPGTVLLKGGKVNLLVSRGRKR